MRRGLGTKPDGHTSTFYNAEVIENGRIRKEPTYLTDFWTGHGVRFIEQNKAGRSFCSWPTTDPTVWGRASKGPPVTAMRRTMRTRSSRRSRASPYTPG